MPVKALQVVAPLAIKIDTDIDSFQTVCVLFTQSKLVYTGHIYAFSTDLINLPYEEVKVLFYLSQQFVRDSGKNVE